MSFMKENQEDKKKQAIIYLKQLQRTQAYSFLTSTLIA